MGAADGFEVVDNRIFVDLGVISGFISVSFWSSKCGKILFVFGLFPGHFFIDFRFDFSMLGLPNRGFRMKGIAQIDCSWKSFLKNFGIDF